MLKYKHFYVSYIEIYDVFSSYSQRYVHDDGCALEITNILFLS